MNKETQFEVGEVVQLVSGGPAMTISCDYHDNVFACQWFVDGVLNEGKFRGTSLVESRTLRKAEVDRMSRLAQ